MNKTVRNVVVVVAKSANLRNSLRKALSSTGYDAWFRVYPKLSDWKEAESTRANWVFLDAFSIDNPDSISKLESWENIVVFNSLDSRKAVATIENSVSRKHTTLQFMEDILTPDVLIENFGKHFSPAGNSEAPISRGKSVRDEEIFELGRQGETTGIEPFLSHLNRGIQTNAERLISDFVDVSSVVKTPRIQQALSSPPIEITDALLQLRSHCTDSDSAGRGAYLLGKAGAGKSTMIHNVIHAVMNEDRGFGVAVDYTLVTARELLVGDLTELIKLAFDKLCATDSVLSEYGEKYPHARSVALRPRLKKMIADNDFSLLRELESHSIEAVFSHLDRSVVTAMYTYYECSGKKPSQVSQGYANQAFLLDDAESWYQDLVQDPGKLVALYLNFSLGETADEGFEAFTFRKMLEYLLLDSPHAEQAKQRLGIEAAKISPELGDQLKGKTADSVVAEAMDIPAKWLRRLCFGMIESLAGQAEIFIVCDNIDQRPSEELEARVIVNAVEFFISQFRRRFPSSRAILCMRGTTFEAQSWVSDQTENWLRLEIRPPNLQQVLERRCDTWRRIGRGVGDGRAYSFVEDIVGMVSASYSDKTHPLLELIAARHPFNVRKQLRSFTDCCQNCLLQESAFGGVRNRRSATTAAWFDKTYEFFQRVFMLGNRNFFKERHDGFLNLFDARRPTSPFNAVIRSWLLRSAPASSDSFDRQEFIARFEGLGVPRELIASTFDSLVRFDLFRAESSISRRFSLSVWGEYFRKHVAYDLPYVSTVWWSTSIDIEFGMGDPKLPVASELNSYAAKFLMWIRKEQQSALQELSTDSKTSISKSKSSDPLNFFDEISENVQFSIQRIEDSIGVRDHRGGASKDGQ